MLFSADARAHDRIKARDSQRIPAHPSAFSLASWLQQLEAQLEDELAHIQKTSEECDKVGS